MECHHNHTQAGAHVHPHAHPHSKHRVAPRIIIPLLMLLGLAALFIIKQYFYVPSFVLHEESAGVLLPDAMQAQTLPSILVFEQAGNAAAAQLYDAVEEFAPEMRGRVSMHYIDIDQNPRTTEAFFSADWEAPDWPLTLFFTAGSGAYVPTEAVRRLGLDFILVTAQGAHTLTVFAGALTEAQLHLILEDMEGDHA